MRRLLVLLCAAVAPLCASSPAWLASLPDGDRWIRHVEEDLLPFWSMPEALGDPTGAFPSIRCDDGTLVDPDNPCPEVARHVWLNAQARYLVPMSRQVYGYGVAYHLTGEEKYLTWLKAGVNYIRAVLVDRAGGGMHTGYDLRTNEPVAMREHRNPQELGYGLLGLAFYYYLTRDPEVLPDILAHKKYVFDNYYVAEEGRMRWLLASNGYDNPDSRQLVAYLDQMNAYLVSLSPFLPEPQRKEWMQTLRTLSHSMVSTFYSPYEGMLFLSANQPGDKELATAGPDFGHSIKSFWMLRWTGRMTGDHGLEHFGATYGHRLLDRAWLASDGAWATGLEPGGAVNRNKDWWIYSELDQFAGSLAMTDIEAGRFLPTTNDYWFRYFVDPVYKEVWPGVEYGTNLPLGGMPKAWTWKSAYHSMEHGLVGYISSQFLHGKPVRLHYALPKGFDPARTVIRPYFFDGEVTSMTGKSCSVASECQMIEFTWTPPVKQSTAVVSGSSFFGGNIAPSMIVSVFGSGLARETAWASAVPLPLNLGGASVTITDSAGGQHAARLVYASPTQLNLIVPAEVGRGPATVTVHAEGAAPVTASTSVVSVQPGIFQAGAVPGLISADVIHVHADGSQKLENVWDVYPGNQVRARPIDLGPETDRIYLSVYTTGTRAATKVRAIMDGREVPVQFSGPQGYFEGLDQVNIGPLPRALAGKGRVTLLLDADGQTSNPVEIVIQ